VQGISPYLHKITEWTITSSHFVERHGLIVIVALGESIVAIGLGGTGPISVPRVAGSVLGLTVAGCVWWAYFDVVALVAERVLRRATGEEQVRIARDSYSYLHLPMIAGIVLLALGLKKVQEYVGTTAGHALDDPLPTLPRAALFGGVALYLLAHVAFRWRNVRSINVQRVVVAVILCVLVGPTAWIPALGALAILAAVTVGLIAFEAVRFSELRERIRHEEEIAVSQLRRHADPAAPEH
jgi:low temperature requirement protein LtrA